MPIQDDHSDKVYGSGVAFIFIFNLIVGTGALAMPASFAETGYILSPIIVSLLCITSFISLTFVIESMSIANFIYKSSTCLYKSSTMTSDSDSESDSDNQNRNSLENSLNSSLNIERTPLINCNEISQNSIRDDENLFDITEQFELGHMARLFFKKSHLKLFYVCVIVYLFGDLTIYSAAISKSLRDVTCTYDNCTKSELDSYDLCWPNMSINRGQVYRLYILIIGLILGPFFNLHNKYSQLTTTIFRWLAFSIMIMLASYALLNGKGEGNPEKANFSKMPNLVGVCVYSFMCHHSITRLIQPVKNKNKLYRLIGFDYAIVLGFYLFLSMTAIFAFKKVEDVYTLNFQKPRCPSSINSTLTMTDQVVPQFEILELLLPLFPVAVLTTNYPILALTLGNNLRSLLLKEPLSSSSSNIGREPLSSKIFFPIIVFIPPILISFSSENVELLVAFTGSYAGIFIQYLIPLFLVYKARYALKKIEVDQEQLYLRSDESFDNLSTRTVPLRNLNKNLFFQNFESCFKGQFWIIFILIWSIFCLLFVTINHYV